MTIDDLQPVDGFHIRGHAARKELIGLAGFSSDMRILDLGCGIGGSTRRLAKETECRVTGIDLSDEYIEIARRLTDLVNMPECVEFHVCSALELPFADNSFDGIWSLQMNMNVQDKLGWLKEAFRALKPGARAVLYEVCGSKTERLHFPVTWAQDDTKNFLVPPSLFRKLIITAGFAIEVWSDKTDLAQRAFAFANAKEPVGEILLPA